MKNYILLPLTLLCFLSVFAQKPLLYIDPMGHSDVITFAAVTPDGSSVITASRDKSIRIWDVNSGELKSTLRGETYDGNIGVVSAGALSNNGNLLAIAGYLPSEINNSDGIRLIDLTKNEQVDLLSGQKSPVTALHYASSEKYLASGTESGNVSIWYVKQGNNRPGIDRAVAPVTIQDSNSAITDLEFSPDNQRLIVASQSSIIHMYEADNYYLFTSQKRKDLHQHTKRVNVLAFSPDNKVFTSGGEDGKVLLWSRDGQFLRQIDELRNPISAIAFNMDGSKLIFAERNTSRIYAYDMNTFKRQLVFTDHTNTILACSFINNSKVISAGGEAYDIFIWDANTGEIVKRLCGKSSRVWAVGFNKEASLGFGNTNRTGNLDDAPLERLFNFSTLSLSSPKMFEGYYIENYGSEESGQKLSYVNEYTVRAGNDTIQNDFFKDGSITSYTFSPDKQMVFVGSLKSLKQYNNMGKYVKEFVGYSGIIWDIAVSPDSKYLATACGDQTIRLWNIATGKLLASLFVANDNEWVCWLPEGYYCASPGGEKYLYLHTNKGLNRLATIESIDKYKPKFYNPAVVIKTIQQGNFTQPEIEDPNANNIEPVLVDDVIQPESPLVGWESPKERKSEVNSANLDIYLTISSATKIQEIGVTINNQKMQMPVKGAYTETDVHEESPPKPVVNEPFTLRTTFQLREGFNTLEVFVRNEKGFSKQTKLVHYKKNQK
ncbi:hypothetical protein C7N43_27230 [Sphingobacteriales bacterium UPWRP_1]|nr:hypothetical protein C7N43_27230 [Sphingobacteriales bacterium UPWRP_1]